jgi:hypothetical protein
VTIQLMVYPGGVGHSVWIDGKKINRPVFEVPRSKTRKVEVKILAEGYRPYRASLLPITDLVLPINLEKTIPPSTPPPADPRGRKPTTRGNRQTRKVRPARPDEPRPRPDGPMNPGERIKTFNDL